MRTSLLLSASGLSAFALALVTGCSSGDNSSTGGTGEAGDITGTVKDDWLTDTGEIKAVPESSVPIAALYQGADKTFSDAPSVYDPNTGSFVIKGVPAGQYYLQLGQGSYFVMTERTDIDFGGVLGGRPDTEPVVTSPTNLALDLTNVTAWQANDSLELFSLGGYAWGDLVLSATAPPMNGATSLTGFTSDLSLLYYAGLVDGTKGDKATVTHLTARTAGMIPYQALGQSLDLPSITVKDGAGAMSSGAFTDVPQKKVTLDWKRSAFASLLASAGPDVALGAYQAYVYIEPGGPDRSSTSGEPTLMFVSDTGGTDVSLDLSYGNPFPADYGEIAFVQVIYGIKENVQFSSNQLVGSTWVSGPADKLFQGPIAPGVSPVTGVTIGGQAATNDLSGVGATPVIAWKAPTTGKPTYYIVGVVEFTSAGRGLVATFNTTDTSVTVPPGVLQNGGQYAAIVSAYTGDYDTKAPYRTGNTGAGASALTRLFSP